MAAYRIAYGEEAKRQIRTLRGDARAKLLDGIERFLTSDAEVSPPTGRRKRMRPNIIAQWRLRLDPHRVYYDVAEDRVTIKAIGVKRGERVFAPTGEELHINE